MSGRVKNDDKNFLSLVNITKMTLNINKHLVFRLRYKYNIRWRIVTTSFER